MHIIETEDTSVLAKLNRHVQKIHHSIEPEIFKPYSEDNMRNLFDQLLNDENISAYIAYYEGKEAGYVLVSKKEYLENAIRNSYSAICIEQISVEEAYKGKNIGKGLVDFVKEQAMQLNINRIEMNYWSKNKNSGEFFRSQGFEAYNEQLVHKI